MKAWIVRDAGNFEIEGIVENPVFANSRADGYGVAA